MKYHAFAVFWWLPWLIIAVALAGVALLIVLAVRTRQRLWKIASLVSAVVVLACSCGGFGVASLYQGSPANASAPVPDTLSLAFVQHAPGVTSETTSLASLNARTGAVRWQHTFDGSSRYPVADMFSAADEHTIYFEADQLQTIVAVGASDGQERWRTPLSNSLVPQSPIRFIAPPVVSDGMVFISASASASAAYSENPPGVLVFALHADTGALAWSLPIKGINANEQAQLLTARQGVLFVELPTGNLVALRGSDGTQLWSAPDSTSGGNPSVVTDGVVSFLQYQHIVALDAPTGKLLWSYPVDDQVTTAFRNPLGIGASSVYVSSNRFINNTAVQYLISLNAQTGNVQWTYQTNFESTGASVTEAGNLVYYAHGSYLDAMRTSNGQRVWRYSAAPNLGFGTPVVVDGVLYVSSNIGSSHTIVMCFGDCPPSTAIYALNASTGAVYWRYASEAIDTSVPPWVTNSAN